MENRPTIIGSPGERARFSAERKGPAPAIGGSSPAQESEMYEQS